MHDDDASGSYSYRVAGAHASGYALGESVLAAGAIPVAIGGVEVAVAPQHHLWSNGWILLTAGIWAVGLLVLAVTAVHHLGSRRRARRLGFQSRVEETSSTFRDTRIGDLAARIYSTADSVTDRVQVDRVSGAIEHRPQLPLTGGSRQEAGASEDCAPEYPDTA